MIVKQDLDAMDLQELKTLQKNVLQAIKDFDMRKRREALKALEEVAQAHGFSLSELTGKPVIGTRRPATPKFANPANSADTWSGRGRQPHWYRDALNAGQPPESMQIRGSAPFMEERKRA